MDGFDELQKGINTSEKVLLQIVLSIFLSQKYSIPSYSTLQVLFLL